MHAEGGRGNVLLLQAPGQFASRRPGKRFEGNDGYGMVPILKAAGKMDQRTFCSAGFQFGNDQTYSHGIIAR